MSKKYYFFLGLIFLAISVSGLGCASEGPARTPLSNPMSSNPTPSITVNAVTDITTQDAFKLIQKNRNNPDFVILDVRTASEFSSGRIANAINIDYYSPDFKSELAKLPLNKQYLVYCRTGVRSASAAQIMLSLGFKNIQNMTGGIVQWLQDGYPTVSQD